MTDEQPNAADATHRDVLAGRWLGRWKQRVVDPPGVDWELRARLTDDEWDQLVALSGSYRALVVRPTFEAIQRTWARLHDTRSFYEHLADYGASFRDVEQRSVAMMFMADVTAWLALTRLYLETERNTVSGLFGSNSEQAGRFKQATNRAFDTSSGYRFLTQLRHYAQHCGPPLGGVEITASDGRSRHLMLYLNRAELASANFEWNRHGREFLDGAPDRIDLWPLLADAMTAIQAIDDEAIALRIEHIVPYAEAVRNAYQRLGDGDGYAVLMDRGNDGRFSHLNLPPLDGLEDVVDRFSSKNPIADLRRTPEVLTIPEPQRETDRRAGAVLAARLHYGPGSEVDALVNEFTRSRYDAVMLAAGFTNLSITLLTIVRQALGSSPEDILGGFLAPRHRERDNVD